MKSLNTEETNKRKTMKNNKRKKVTEIEIASYFATTTQTLRNWRNSEEVGENERYSALREYYIKHKKGEENE